MVAAVPTAAVATAAVEVVSAAAVVVEVFRAAGLHRVEGFRTEAEVEVGVEASAEAGVAASAEAVNTAAGRLPRAEDSARAA